MPLNNRRRHHEVISLLTTIVLSLSLRSLVCYQTNSFVCERLLAGRASIFLTFAARSTIIYFGKDQGSCEWLLHTHATFGQCERLANVLSTNYFRRTDENPLLWAYHYAQSFFLAPKMITIIKKICFPK